MLEQLNPSAEWEAGRSKEYFIGKLGASISWFGYLAERAVTKETRGRLVEAKETPIAT